MPARTRAPLDATPVLAHGRYVIVGELGAGSMGVVFEARDVELGRMVALKLVHARARHHRQAQLQLRQEAQAMARLSHPNVASVFDIGMAGNRLFIAMELVRGTTLRSVVRSDAPWRDKLALAIAAGRGLAAAHDAGVVHRDFKPDNVLVRADGGVRVSDFGLARAVCDDDQDDASTGTAAIAGTLAYMAPESFDGVADALTDQFALAVTMFELLEGRRPFDGGGSATERRARLATGLRPVWRRRVVPRAIRSVIERGLALDRAARWPSVSAMCAALERRLHRRAGTRMLGIVGAVAVAAVVFATRHDSRPVTARPTFATATQQQLTFTGQASFPTMSADGKQLAYVLGQRGRSVAVQDLEHGRTAEVFESASGDIQLLRWSPDGTRLAIGDSTAVTVISADGRKHRRFRAAFEISWSPDGTQLALLTGVSTVHLTVADVETGTEHGGDVALPGTFLFRGCDWSVSGEILILAKEHDHGYSLWTVRPGETEAHKIYRDERSTWARYAVWSAHGRAIYYQRERDQTTEIVRLALDGGRTVTVEQVVFTSQTFGGGFSVPDDERSLVYPRTEESSQVVVTSRGQRTVLAADTRTKRGLTVSPDGARIAFISGAGERGELNVMARDGGSRQVVRTAEGAPLALAWSPDGERLAYIVATAAGRQLWTVALATGVARRVDIATLSAHTAHLAWTARDELMFLAQDNRNIGVLAPGQAEQRALVPGAPGWMYYAMPSSEGSRVATVWNRPAAPLAKLFVISSEDQSAVPIFSEMLAPIGWSDDDAWVFAEDNLRDGGVVLAIDASGTGRSRVVFDHTPVHTGSLALLPGGEGWVAVETSWRSDLWLASLDGRRPALPSTPSSVVAVPVVQPALRNGAMTIGSIGSAPADWTTSGFVDDDAKLVLDCGQPDDRCLLLRGAVEQRIDAAAYRGHRMRLHARGRAEHMGVVEVWVQAPAGLTLSARLNVESASWTTVALDADIRADAEAVVIRLLTRNTSRAWFDDISVERVDR